MKLSFKKEPRETGLAGVGRPWPNVLIKADRKKVGTIVAKNWHQDKYQIWLTVKQTPTVESRCPFRSVKLKFECDTEEEAREFLQKSWETILKKFELHQFED